MYPQSEKSECDENQEENASGDKEPSGLKQRLMQRLKTEGGKCFYVTFHQWKVRGRAVSLVIWPVLVLGPVFLEKLGEKVILDPVRRVDHYFCSMFNPASSELPNVFLSRAQTAAPEAQVLLAGSSACWSFPGVKRQATLPFKPLKKMKKKNPWSDSGSDSEPDFEALPQRERVVRRAAGEGQRTKEGPSGEEKVERALHRAPEEVLGEESVLFYCIYCT